MRKCVRQTGFKSSWSKHSQDRFSCDEIPRMFACLYFNHVCFIQYSPI